MQTLPRFLAFLLMFLLFAIGITSAQTISPRKGYSPQIGSTVEMLEDLKNRVVRSVAHIDQDQTDYLLDEDANRIGAMILHLAATEKYYQVLTFENRTLNKEEAAKWDIAQNLGENARAELVGKPIEYYLKIWEEIRAETLRLLQTKDDKWFNKKVKGSSMNNHWAWYHVMEHQANHMGQIRLILKRSKE